MLSSAEITLQTSETHILHECSMSSQPTLITCHVFDMFASNKSYKLTESASTTASTSSCSRAGLARFITFQPSVDDIDLKSFTIIRTQIKDSRCASQFLAN